MTKSLVEVIGLGPKDKILLCEGYILEGPSGNALDRIVLLPLFQDRSYIGIYVSNETGRYFSKAEYYCTNVSPISPLDLGFVLTKDILERLYPYVDSEFQLRKEFCALRVLEIK